MLNISKICRILLAAAFVCVLLPEQALAITQYECNANCQAKGYLGGSLDAMTGRCDCWKQDATLIDEGGNTVETDLVKNPLVTAQKIATGTCTEDRDCGSGKICKNGKCELSAAATPQPVSTTPTTGVAVNTTQSAGAVSGCSGNLGLFSGLITTGKTIFEGMRDLIYVVAGFGIIGVAVGGFFGNLNWKWLGAIIIGLVVIATTGELITAITGCTEFTSTMIQDTLK